MALIITAKALAEIARQLKEIKEDPQTKAFLAEQDNENKSLFLRIRVKTHGCGLVPELSFEIKTEPNDKIFEHSEITVRMDPMSAEYLKDTKLDYAKNGLLGGLKFDHPTNFHSCGCGRTFTPDSKK